MSGVAFTLARLAVSAGSGMASRPVRAWAMHVLQDGGFPTRTSDRAKLLLDDVRKRVSWVPDPTSEMSVDPSMMVPNLLTGEKPTAAFGDADDLAVLLASLMGSVGIRCQLVGCGYSDDGPITHVLVAYWNEETETWVNVDPSVEATEANSRPNPVRVLACPVPPRLERTDFRSRTT